jgi:hypothetical protein
MSDWIVLPLFLAFLAAVAVVSLAGMSRQARGLWRDLRPKKTLRGFDVLPPRKP